MIPRRKPPEKMPDVQVPLDHLDSVVLLVRGLEVLREEANKKGNVWDGRLPLGCIQCTRDVVTTHNVAGYGDMCPDCAQGEPRASPYPWAGPFIVLHRRGLKLPER